MRMDGAGVDTSTKGPSGSYCTLRNQFIFRTDDISRNENNLYTSHILNDNVQQPLVFHFIICDVLIRFLFFFVIIITIGFFFELRYIHFRFKWYITILKRTNNAHPKFYYNFHFVTSIFNWFCFHACFIRELRWRENVSTKINFVVGCEDNSLQFCGNSTFCFLFLSSNIF